MIYYVNQAAPREGDGSKARPFRHISDAARIALPGDEVLVYPGVYREQVSPRNGGTEDKRITYRSVEPLGALITGAEEVSGSQEGAYTSPAMHSSIVSASYRARSSRYTQPVWRTVGAKYQSPKASTT